MFKTYTLEQRNWIKKSYKRFNKGVYPYNLVPGFKVAYKDIKINGPYGIYQTKNQSLINLIIKKFNLNKITTCNEIFICEKIEFYSKQVIYTNNIRVNKVSLQIKDSLGLIHFTYTF